MDGAAALRHALAEQLGDNAGQAASQHDAHLVLLVGRKGLDPETVATIQTTFEEHFDELLTAMLEGKDNAKYANAKLVEVTDQDYDRVRSMYQAVGVNDFSQFLGD